MASRTQLLRIFAKSPRRYASSSLSLSRDVPTVRTNIARNGARNFSISSLRSAGKGDSKDDPYHSSSTAAASGDTAEHEGKFARTDKSVRVAYPEDQLPRSQVVEGRGAVQFKRTLDKFSLEGRVAVVTGGARGLGLVMGQALLQSGAELAIVDLNKEEADHQANELTRHFRDTIAPSSDSKSDAVPKITAHYCDVASPESVDSAVSSIVSAHGKIDHLVTSAGFTENYPAIDYPYDRMKKLWGVNVDGTYLWATAVARHLISRSSPGSMVLIGSMSGSIVNIPQPQAPYNAAKAAVRHLAASLAVELASSNIRVNCISPGYMLTALTRKILDDNPELNKKWTSLIPQGKMGRPEDLMGAVTFLLSDAAAYVTGSDLRVDGGYTVT